MVHWRSERRRRPASWLATVAAAGLTVIVGARPAAAQPQKPGQEFTRQGLLVANFTPGAGTDTVLGDRIADLLRDRLGEVLDEREVDVVKTGELRGKLQRAGFDARGVVDMQTLEQLGRNFRVDEFLLGTVSRGQGGVRLDAQLVLARDRRLRQPLATVTAGSPETAVEHLSRALVAARGQLAHQRRCENSLRAGKHADAIRAARAGAAAFPQGALARTCLVTALRHTGARAPDLLEAARELLAIDSMSAHGLEAAAIALDTLKRRDEAAATWLRLAATDSANMELTERVLWALHENGNSRAAEPLVVRVAEAHPDSLRLLHLKWRITTANSSWKHAVAAGESLLLRDSIVAADSGFVARLVTAYERNGQPFHALAAAARGVATIPSARLYAVYAELVRSEADTVLPRGLALYPRSADLLALNARTLREQGKIAEALAATREAVAIDPTLPDGQLSIAQAEFDLGQPDSALVTLYGVVYGRAPAPVVGGGTTPAAFAATSTGDAPPQWSAALGAAPTQGAAASGAAVAAAVGAVPSDSVLSLAAQFALAKGNTLLRAANATKTLEGFDLASRFLTLGDSLRPSAQGGFLRGVAALGVASAAVTRSVGQPLAEGCRLLHLAARQLPVARTGLEGGRTMAAEATEQYLGFLAQLQPYVDRQLPTCARVPAAVSGTSVGPSSSDAPNPPPPGSPPPAAVPTPAGTPAATVAPPPTA